MATTTNYEQQSLENEKTRDADVDVVELSHGGPAVNLDARHNFTAEEGKKILRRVDIHLLILLWVAYLMKNLDSNNVSYLKVMNAGKPTNILNQLHMSTDDYAWLSTAFTITFMLFELPSNLLMKYTTPRLHFVRIMVLWSVISCLFCACKNFAGMLACRAALGIAEAGLWPGIITQLSMWYRPDEIAVRLVSISLLGQFSNILSALLAYGLAYIDGRGGLSGWQWMFLIEGLIGIVVAGFIYFLHPDYPEDAKFLTQPERDWMCARLPANVGRKSDANFDKAGFASAWKDPLTWGFSMVMLMSQTASVGYSFWLPSIIVSFGFLDIASSQLLNIPPAAIYVISALCMGYWLDHQSRIPRPIFMIFACVVSIGAFLGLMLTQNKPALYFLIMLSSVTVAVYQTNIYPWRSQTVQGATNAATAFAIQNSIGQLAGIFAAQIFRAQYAPRYTVPFAVCLAFWGASIVAVCFTWWKSYGTEKETRRIAQLRWDAAKRGEVIDEDVEVPKK